MVALPPWHYNKPNLDGTAVSSEQARKNINYPVWLPQSFDEVFAFAGVMIAAHRIKSPPWVNFGPLNFGLPFTGIPRVVSCLGVTFFGCRSAKYLYNRYCEKNKIIFDDYLSIYPEKFSNHPTKKISDTWGDWWVVRSGGRIFAWTVSGEKAIAKPPQPDHYMPKRDGPLPNPYPTSFERSSD